MAPIILDFIAHNARLTPDREAIREFATGRSWTFAQFDADVRRATALLLARMPDVAGQRIAMLSRNSAAMLIVQGACVRAGAIFVPLNWRLAPPEIAFLIDDCTPALLIHEGALDALVPADCAVPMIRIGDDHDALAAEMAGYSADGVGEGMRIDPETPITILYSSGTTGKPKGAVVTFLNGFSGGLGLALGARVTADSGMLIDMPLFHTAGLFGACWSTMIMGGRLLISQKFDAPVTYARLADPALGVSHYFSVTQMAMMMRQLPKFDGPGLARLTAYITGGSPNPEAHHRLWLDDGVQMLNGWGMSETCSSTLTPPGDFALLAAKAGSIGREHLSIELRVVRDAIGTEAAQGEVGELWARGATVTPGYWNRPELNATAFVDGWFRTGDAAMRDADGYYYLVDRIKDMFISGGENVYPAEIEAAIVELGGVGEVAVIGVPDARWGEVGCAFVIPAPGASLSSEGVLAHCKARLAGYKVPKSVIISDAIERTASGKVQKHLLKERWHATLADA